MHKHCLLLVLCCFAYGLLHGLTVGSDNNVSRETLVSIPADPRPPTNIIKGFAYIDEGFAFEDATTTCTFDSVFPVRGVVGLSGGKLFLEQDLILSDELRITGSGEVWGFQNYSVTFPSRTSPLQLPESENMYLQFRHAGVVLQGDIAVNKSKLEFKGACSLNAQGNMLDLTNGSSLWIKSGSSLRVNNAVIKGWGKGGIILEDETCQLYCSGVTFILDNNVTFTKGVMYLHGRDTTLITGDNSITFGRDGSLTVDSVALWYDSLSNVDDGNIITNDTETLLNDAEIRSVKHELLRTTSNAVVHLDNPGCLVNPATLPNDVYLHALPERRARKILVTQDTVLDGNNNTIDFSCDGALIDIANNTTLEIKNAVLKNFSPDHVFLNRSGSIRFGDGIIMRLSPNSNDSKAGGMIMHYTFSFQGEGACLIDGSGNTLNLNGDLHHAMSVLGTTSLTIFNAGLKGLKNDNIACKSSGATLGFADSVLMMSDSFTFSCGHLRLMPDVLVRGDGHTFALTTDKNTTISSQAIITFDQGVTFSYDPASAPSKTKLMMEDSSVGLFFNGSTLHTTGTGLRIDSGYLFIDNHVTFTSEARYDAESLEIGSAVTVNVLSGGLLDLHGHISITS